MKGLDRIVERIELDSKKASADIIDSAQREADEAFAASKEKALAEAAVITEAARARCVSIAERSASACLLESRKNTLIKKQQLIADCLQKAKQTMLELPDNEYFSLLEGLAAKHAHSQSGEMILSAGDLKRLSPDFADRIGKFGLSISAEVRGFEGGFILKYGDIEENCTFNSLFQSRADELQDKTHGLLFG